MSDAVSKDGSPVDVYAALPAEPELSVVRAHLKGRMRVLDLGCGTGRIADPLVENGHDVVAVDESEQMVRRVQHAHAVQSPIEELNVGRSFDAVLLLSHLVNAATAPAFLDAAARHLAEGGILLAQRLEPGRQWLPGSMQVGPVTVALVDLLVDGDRILGTTRYSLGDRSWDQRWELWERSDEQIATLLNQAGLRLLSADGVWITATQSCD